MRLSALHPHPNPPPSEGEGIFYLPLSAHRGGRDISDFLVVFETISQMIAADFRYSVGGRNNEIERFSALKYSFTPIPRFREGQALAFPRRGGRDL